MKISSCTTQSLPDGGSTKPDTKRVGRAASAATGGASDVKLSDLSSQLAEMETKLAASDAFDVKKVDAIKLAISEGKFQVNPGAVADKLLLSVREMLGK